MHTPSEGENTDLINIAGVRQKKGQGNCGREKKEKNLISG